MLRISLLVFAGALALVGALLLTRGLVGPGCYALGVGGVIFLGTAFERWRYRPSDSGPGAHWEPTAERFQDPHSGETLQVFYDPRTGERRYVSDSGAPADALPKTIK